MKLLYNHNPYSSTLTLLIIYVSALCFAHAHNEKNQQYTQKKQFDTPILLLIFKTLFINYIDTKTVQYLFYYH